MKIVIVDNHKEFISSLKYYIKKKLGYEVIATFPDNRSFEKNIPDNFDIILMDISIPINDGYSMTKELNWTNPDIKIIAITMLHDNAYLEKLINHGFKGCVFKNEIVNNLDTAIKTVYKGGLYFPNIRIKS